MARWKKSSWMILPSSSEDPVATLKPHKPCLFRKDRPARVNLPHGIFTDEAMFFLVLLIYLQVTKESKEGKAEAMGAVGDLVSSLATS